MTWGRAGVRLGGDGALRAGRAAGGLWRAGALAVAAATLAGPARASAPIRIVWPGRPGVLRTGEVVAIRWAHADPAASEAELLLIVDTGTSFTLRLTPQFGPGLASYAWVVPNLPARAARLCLRQGIDGREVESEPSAAFRIESDPDEPPSPLRFCAGEWWMGMGPSQPPPEPGPGLAASRPEVEPDAPEAMPATCPPAAGAGARLPASRSARRGHAQRSRDDPRPPRLRRPLSAPLRD